MVDIPGNASTTTTMSIGGTLTDSLEVLGDHDWIAITLTAGQAVDVMLNGISLNDPFLNIRDSAGNVIYSNDDIVDGVNRNSEVKFNPSYTGTYYIDVGAYNDASAGTYQVSVQLYTPPPVFTNDQIAAQLTSGYWSGDVHHWAATQGGTITVNISTMNAADQNLARAALGEWSDIIGVRFQEVATGGQIVFSDAAGAAGSGPIAQTDANWSNGIITSAHVHISASWVTRYGTGLSTYSFQTYVHEIGHALGLGHAGNYNNTATYPYDALFANDGWPTSIMSYFDQQENTYFGNQGFSLLYDSTPMAADILAMQTLYGLSTTTRTGDTTYGYHSNAGGVFDAVAYPRSVVTIFDSGGNDTLDYSGNSTQQLLNLNPETFSNVDGYVGNLSIARGTIIENAIGGNGADTIIGNSAKNVLTGNLGADMLTGGGGNDIFLDTIAGHNGDTITDFVAGDKIVFSDAAAGSFTYSLSGNTLNYGGGALTLGSGAGKLVASAAATGGVQLILQQGAHNDYNGDLRSDMLIRDVNGNYVTEWVGSANGALVNNGVNSTLFFGAEWQIAATGDFNGDGRTDFLIRNTSGWVTDWLGNANGSFTNNGSNASLFFASNWQVAGSGDYNGDGKSDFLLRDSVSGTLTDWLGTATGGFSNNGANATVSVSADWHVVGTGDFNGDGRDDFLIQNSAGWVTDWLGNASGGFTNNGANTSLLFASDWHVLGTGDFNGDGRADFLLQNNAGWVTDWLGTASGGFTNNGANTSLFFAADWHIASVGDFNGDGKSDLLLRSDAGWTTDWLGTASGSFSSNGSNFSAFIATNWHVQDPFL